MKTVIAIIIFLISYDLLATMAPTPQAITLVSIKGKSNDALYKEAWIRAYNTEEDYQVHSDTIVLMDLLIMRDSRFAPAYYLKGLSYRLMAMRTSDDYDIDLLKMGDIEVGKALALSPNEPLYIVEKADNLNKRNYKKDALELVDKALQIKPNFPRALLLKSELMIDGDKLDQAEKLLSLVEKDPNDEFLEYRSDWHWCEIYRKKKMPKEGEALYLKWINKRPKSSWNLVNYASFLIYYDRFTEAIQATDRCLVLSDVGMCHHHKALAHAALGDQIFENGDFDKSMKHYESAFQNDEMNEEAINGLGKVYQSKNDEAKALMYFEKGCDLKYSSSCNYIGEIFFKKGNYKKSEEYSDKSCELGDANSCSNSADIKWRLGNKPDAIKYFGKACKLGDEESCLTLKKFKSNAGANK